MGAPEQRMVLQMGGEGLQKGTPEGTPLMGLQRDAPGKGFQKAERVAPGRVPEGSSRGDGIQEEFPGLGLQKGGSMEEVPEAPGVSREGAPWGPEGGSRKGFPRGAPPVPERVPEGTATGPGKGPQNPKNKFFTCV